MTFVERQFPADIRLAPTGGPVYRTTVKQLRGGAERRNSLWADPLRSLTFTLGPRDTDQIREVLEFIASTRGAANGFRVKDWSDYQVYDQWQGVGDGSSYWFRLFKHYGSDYHRRILKPVPGTTVVRIDGARLHPSLYTVGTVNGLLILKNTPVPGSVITASFEFDVPVRFADDTTNITMLMHRLGQTESIEVKEIRLREVIDLDVINAARALL